MLHYLEDSVKYHLKLSVTWSHNGKQSGALSKGLLFRLSNQRTLKSKKKFVGLELRYVYKKQVSLACSTFHVLYFSIVKVILVGPSRS